MTDAVMTTHFGSSVQFVSGAGLGFGFVGADGFVGGSFRLPTQLGVEFLTSSSTFGFGILARPWLELGGATTGGASGSFVGGGLVGVLSFTAYTTRR